MLRKTWVPSGRLGELERELGVRIRFFVGYSQQRGDAVEAELAEEARQHGDMERLAVQDEYGELSRKTARLFSQMSSTVHADFYFKIDDDVGERGEGGGACACGCAETTVESAGSGARRSRRSGRREGGGRRGLEWICGLGRGRPAGWVWERVWSAMRAAPTTSAPTAAIKPPCR